MSFLSVNYAPIEAEALAVADSLEKARFFVLGCNDLTIAVDHKPLLNVFNDRSLDKIPNSRLRNLKERTLRFRFNMVHIPGVKHKAADTAPRYPTGSEDPESQPLPDDIADTETNITSAANNDSHVHLCSINFSTCGHVEQITNSHKR